MTEKEVVEEAGIKISQIGAETLRIPIIGTAPLLMHRFSEKSKLMQEMQRDIAALKRRYSHLKGYKEAMREAAS